MRKLPYVCTVYTVVAIVCLVPVAILYLIFGNINYFGLEGTWRGVVATGPIAAYVLLYIYTLRHVLSFMKIGSPLMKEKDALDWERKEARARALPVDLPKVEGAWIGTWAWADEDTGETTTYTETLEIKQHGREIAGTIKDDLGQESAFRGVIFARMVTFHFVSTRNSRLSCGSVTVRVNADGTSMDGHQIFFALDLERLVTTAYNLSPRE